MRSGVIHTLMYGFSQFTTEYLSMKGQSKVYELVNLPGSEFGSSSKEKKVTVPPTGQNMLKEKGRVPFPNLTALVQV